MFNSDTPTKIIEPDILHGDEPGVGIPPDRELPLLGGVFPTNKGFGATIYNNTETFSCEPTVVTHEWTENDEYIQVQIGPYHDTMITPTCDSNLSEIVPCECPEYERRMNYLCVKLKHQRMDR